MKKAISAANVLGKNLAEVQDIYDDFATAEAPDRFLHVVYWLGKLAIGKVVDNNKKERLRLVQF